MSPSLQTWRAAIPHSVFMNFTALGRGIVYYLSLWEAALSVSLLTVCLCVFEEFRRVLDPLGLELQM